MKLRIALKEKFYMRLYGGRHMKNRIIFAAVIMVLSLAVLAGDGFGEDEKQVVPTPAPQAAAKKTEAPKARVPKKDMTREEMISELKEELKSNEELFDLFPDMKSKKGDDGNAYFTFKGIKIEDMPKEDIDNLLTKARQALTKIRTDRIERQLEIVRRVERLNRAAAPLQSPRVPAAPPSSPRAVSAPRSPLSAPRSVSAPPLLQSPRVPAAPPSTPRAPSAPPPPRR